MNVTEYIKKNYKKTIRTKECAVNSTKIFLPKPFTVPCADEVFMNFYYWDTYFTNLMLYSLNDISQAKNNIDNMKYLVETLGFIPNADHILENCQPPLFAQSVYDYYLFTKDNNESISSTETLLLILLDFCICL